MKVGIIQAHLTPGDFPRNVRAIIEAYRACLDRGADLILAPAMSLSGPAPGGLLLRSAYEREHDDALQYMSQEMANTPLILGSAEGMETHGYPRHRFYVLRHESVTRLKTQPGVVAIQGIKTLILPAQHGLALSPSKVCGAELILYFPESPWQIGQTENLVEAARATAMAHGIPVGVIRQAGGRDEFVDAGSSFLMDSTGKLCGTLAPFDVDERVFSTVKTGSCKLPDEKTSLKLAVLSGIRDYVRKGGYTGVMLIREESMAFHLLEKLCTEALGVLPVIEDPEGGDILERAEASNLLLLSPCTKNALYTGVRPQAHYLPLGDMSDGELAQLSGKRGKVSQNSQEDEILHQLVDYHRSGTDLISDGYPEISVRTIQRRIERSAWSRRQAPPILYMHGPQIRVPLLHRFSD